MAWVYEHHQITMNNSLDRVSLPDKGEHVGRRGRKATGQGWVLIAELPKEKFFKRQRQGQNFRALIHAKGLPSHAASSFA